MSGDVIVPSETTLYAAIRMTASSEFTARRKKKPPAPCAGTGGGLPSADHDHAWRAPKGEQIRPCRS